MAIIFIFARFVLLLFFLHECFRLQIANISIIDDVENDQLIQ